ncbi:ATP-binding sensor histidine kinase [Okeania sp. SIO1I7]|uniref:trifunctional serine/threonine-protein kinase/ATP-binding protein/sensor histidine kinase n=1 Tax=Okeania sp. SIO1I7 TaxID=2607772 RepID=UPI0013FBEA34|nr:ATP-binding sensor histidine kinase [Okeania sp. SIO1I7]NET29953.1 AAA family ATPase [Okeania sp. SIO1I7]
MINIPGYQILVKIYEGNNSVVYRGKQEEDDRPVVLKFSKGDFPSEAENNRYQKEYEILSSLNFSGVIKAYGLEKYNNILVMILEDFGGESLKTVITSQKFTILGFLNLAIKIAESLGEIHSAKIIHKDINPSNIIVNLTTRELKIIDFNISSVLNRDSYKLKNQKILEGTLPYISPEQTGRMNCSLDYRTDFYSLGVTFYELLTQQLPFTNTDVMELVHAHIAKQPKPPHEINPEVPHIISNIVLKLLAKTADERYQSAWGLIADLDECLNQLQMIETIVEFPLGSQDISDKFKIPSKLYGRQLEIETLIATFERVCKGSKEMMLVTGYSGIGKSALVQAISQPIIRQGGYFICGKFDQFQRGIPYSAIVSAFSELVRIILSQSEAKLHEWRNKLLAAFGTNGQILIDVIPELELIVGTQPKIQELGPNEAQNRFNIVFQNFIGLFCQPEHPLVIFLDDLQWADSATLKLIKLMMTDVDTKYLFLIGAYRDNEISPTHPLVMTLNAIRTQSESMNYAQINQINLTPLKFENINQLIAETLYNDRVSVQPLAKLVESKTGGNPFFVNEFMKTLYQENLLKFDSEQIRWEWNMEQITALDITDNVVELMIGKLEKLPTLTQKVLSLVACVGNQFDLNTLSLIYEKESYATFQDLLPAIQEGLILPASETEAKNVELNLYPFLILNYKFLHDRVQQAAYTFIDESQKQALHLRIGRLFLKNTPPEYRSERVFDLVDHLNIGRNLITDESEKIELAKLNLEAGKKAKDATAYVAAKEYITAGISLLDRDCWTQCYDLTFALYKEGAIVEYLNSNFSESEALIKLTLEHSKSVIEKTEVYNLLVVQYTLRAQYKEAIAAAKKALGLLEIELPETDLQTVINQEFTKVKENLGTQAIASLIHKTKSEKSKYKVALALITNLMASTYLTSAELWTVIVLKGVNISLKYGSVAESCLCYCNYGVILNSSLGDYLSAYQFGLLALKLTDKWEISGLKCKACAGFANGLSFWFKHIKESNLINNEGYGAALESGDLEYAGYLLHNTAINSLFQGRQISEIWKEVSRYLQFTQKTKNQLSTDTLIGIKSIIENLQAKTKKMDINSLQDEKIDFDIDKINETEYLESCQQHQNFYSLCMYLINKSFILYLYRDLDAALHSILDAKKYLTFITGTVPTTEFNFYYSLILAALYSHVSESKQKEYWQQLEKNQQQMKIWADNCQENFEHKYLLVEAEKASIDGKNAEAIDLYNQAIESAKKNEFIQYEALGNELAAKYWLNQNKFKYAKVHLQEAYYAYQNWGATRKLQDLENQYPELSSILTVKDPIIDTSTTAISRDTTNHGQSLDLATVIKASQAISSEIVLDKLLSKLMKILIENAGAEKGVLLLLTEGKLITKAEAKLNSEEVVVQESKINEYEDLPLTIINYVERTRQDVVLSNTFAEDRFTTDSYVAQTQLKSVLCTPIINGGQLIGVLYLENNLITGAFTPERLEILRLLSSQVAVSLENAILYTFVEQKVQERTQELNEKNLRLEQTLQQLQRTQSQLIQSEKMSSLGQLVAGVAHEINNPIGFIYGNLSPATEYVSDLLNLIDLYQEHYPEPVEEIQDEIEDIELEFLVEDLQKLLNSMKVGAERIRDIVISLRNFSRLDEAEMKPVNIHEGIDSTFLILHTRIKEKSDKREVEIVRNYGQLPQVICYVSQMNQVFMNLFSNAIDALAFLRDKQQEFDDKPTITVSTEVTESNTVKIKIGDNGSGINSETLSKIFDPFFTTKPVGAGTGLGLSISYSIVVEKHQGNLSCVSEVGKGTEFIIEIPIKPATGNYS